MTLQTSGTITLQQIGLEFNQTAPYTVSEVMGLPGVPSTGPVSFSDFYGLENLNSWNIESSAIHENLEYSSSTSSITLNWNQATQAASGGNSVQPYDNDFDDWQVGDLLIVATKLQNYLYNSGYSYLRQYKFLNSPSSDWTRAGHTSGTEVYATTAVFAKVLTVSDVTNGNGSYNFSISGSNTADGYSFGFCWWRLRKSTSSGHQTVYLNRERINSSSNNNHNMASGDPPSVNDGINGTNQYTTGSNAILVGVGQKYNYNTSWGTQTNYSSTELSDMNANSFSHNGPSNYYNSALVQNFFASIQTWDADSVPDSNLSASMNAASGTWAWLYTNP